MRGATARRTHPTGRRQGRAAEELPMAPRAEERPMARRVVVQLAAAARLRLLSAVARTMMPLLLLTAPFSTTRCPLPDSHNQGGRKEGERDRGERKERLGKEALFREAVSVREGGTARCRGGGGTTCLQQSRRRGHLSLAVACPITTDSRSSIPMILGSGLGLVHHD